MIGRSFEEREAPLQAMGHAELLARLDHLSSHLPQPDLARLQALLSGY